LAEGDAPRDDQTGYVREDLRDKHGEWLNKWCWYLILGVLGNLRPHIHRALDGLEVCSITFPLLGRQVFPSPVSIS
jgi:hypothetical protein